MITSEMPILSKKPEFRKKFEHLLIYMWLLVSNI